MSNKKFPLIVFMLMVILAIVLTNCFFDDYKSAWEKSPNSPLSKYLGRALIIGFVIASIAIFSALACIEGGYDIFLVTDTGFCPIVTSFLATVILSAVLGGILKLVSIITSHWEITKTWAVLTLIIEIGALIWQTCWFKADITVEHERVDWN
jgi:hypothetical protein